MWPQPVTFDIRVNGAPPSGDLGATVGSGTYSLTLSDLTTSTRYVVEIIVRNSVGASGAVRSATTL